jgi:DDE family transposase
VDVVPSAVAVARFRVDHEAAIERVFVDVLRLCAQAGLAKLGTIAIDGTKIASDAALDANRSASAIRAEVARIMAEAAAADDAETVQPTITGELPDDLARPGSRRARLEAALAQIEAAEAARRAERDERAAKAAAEAVEGRKLRGRKPSDPHAALDRAQADVVAARTKAAATSGKKASERAAEALATAEAAVEAARAGVAAAPPRAEGQANTTDPESRIMKTASGWVQGYNAQAAVNAGQVIVAASVTQEHNDVNQLQPMIDAVASELAAAGIDAQVGIVLADAGYWSDDNATVEGPDRLIATTKDWKQRRAARQLGTTVGPPPEGASPLEAMEHRLRTPEGAAAYALRSCTVEPVFGQAKENRGIRRFMRRGLAAAQSEWSLVCATSNILKLHTHAQGRSLATIISPQS